MKQSATKLSAEHPPQPESSDDPDKGLELREEVKARLKRSLARERKGVRGIPAAEVAKRLDRSTR